MNLKSIRKLFYLLRQKLFNINDTPQRIALGVGLGVFFGIMPGMGPVAALFLAHVFKVNKAAALFGSLLTNTWLSLLTFLLSIKLGAAVFKLNWQVLYNQWPVFLKNFNFSKLFTLPMLRIALPIVVGYIIVAFCAGFLVFITTVIIITGMRNIKSKITPPFP